MACYGIACFFVSLKEKNTTGSTSMNGYIYTLDAPFNNKTLESLPKKTQTEAQTHTIHSNCCSKGKHTHTHAQKIGEKLSTAGNEAINKLMPCQIRGSLNAVVVSILLLFQAT